MSAYGDPTDPILNPPTLNFFLAFSKKKSRPWLCAIPLSHREPTLLDHGNPRMCTASRDVSHANEATSLKVGYSRQFACFVIKIGGIFYGLRSYFRCENGGAKWSAVRSQWIWHRRPRLRRNWRNRGIWSSSRIVGECFARWWGRCAAWFREIYRRIDRWQWSISAPCYEFVHSPMIDVPLVQITNKASDFFLLFYFEPVLWKFMQETDRYRAK